MTTAKQIIEGTLATSNTFKALVAIYELIEVPRHPYPERLRKASNHLLDVLGSDSSYVGSTFHHLDHAIQVALNQMEPWSHFNFQDTDPVLDKMLEGIKAKVVSAMKTVDTTLYTEFCMNHGLDIDWL